MSANAVAYTIIKTATENGLNPIKYLTYLFENLPNLEFYRDQNSYWTFYHGQKRFKKLGSKLSIIKGKMYPRE